MPDMQSAPVWLLDVDGVLNAANPGWGHAPKQGDARALGVTFHLRWAPDLISRLLLLHRAAVVEIRWATTWADHIDEVERLFGLPSFPVAFAELGTAPSVKAPDLKRSAVLQVIESERRPLLWTDDDALEVVGPVVERLDASGLPVMIHAPDPWRGLQPGDLDAIEEFLFDPWASLVNQG